MRTIIIWKNTIIWPYTCIYSNNHNYTKKNIPIHKQWFNCKKVVIWENVWIWANSIILPWVNIWNNTIIWAGSVVTKDQPSDSICVWNPCKFIKNI